MLGNHLTSVVLQQEFVGCAFLQLSCYRRLLQLLTEYLVQLESTPQRLLSLRMRRRMFVSGQQPPLQTALLFLMKFLQQSVDVHRVLA